MNLEVLKSIFSAHNLPDPSAFQKIEVGFTNMVYAIDDCYILKICSETSNERPFKIEAELYRHFKDKLPVPKVLVYDEAKSRLPNSYIIYPMIEGDNLYNVWHTYSSETRRQVIKQLCSMLKVITAADATKFATLLNPLTSWKDYILDEISKYSAICFKAGTLTSDQLENIKAFCAKYGDCLNEERIALVYWDAHFDNILVQNGVIVGMLDFERTELASIDFMLDVVKRMIDSPKAYMSKYAEQFARKEDYAQLFEWYREFYPELFEFKEINRRVDFYSLAHDLEDLENWPNVKRLRDSVEAILSR